MKKIFIYGIILFVGLATTFYIYVSRDHEKLYETVKADFSIKYPEFQFIDCGVGEGDMVVAYVHVRFRKSGDDQIHEEVWQYWDIDSAWLHRDKYLELRK